MTRTACSIQPQIARNRNSWRHALVGLPLLLLGCNESRTPVGPDVGRPHVERAGLSERIVFCAETDSRCPKPGVRSRPVRIR